MQMEFALVSKGLKMLEIFVKLFVARDGETCLKRDETVPTMDCGKGLIRNVNWRQLTVNLQQEMHLRLWMIPAGMLTEFPMQDRNLLIIWPLDLFDPGNQLHQHDEFGPQNELGPQSEFGPQNVHFPHQQLNQKRQL